MLRREIPRDRYGRPAVVVREVIEARFGKRHKYEIIRSTAPFTTSFSIHRDGSRWKSDIATLPRAIEIVEKHIRLRD